MSASRRDQPQPIDYGHGGLPSPPFWLTVNVGREHTPPPAQSATIRSPRHGQSFTSADFGTTDADAASPSPTFLIDTCPAPAR